MKTLDTVLIVTWIILFILLIVVHNIPSSHWIEHALKWLLWFAVFFLGIYLILKDAKEHRTT